MASSIADNDQMQKSGQTHLRKRLDQQAEFFAADQLVWIETPAHIAADRIAGRTGGNSRFDGRPPDEIAARLVNLLELYNLIVGLFERHANIHVLSLRGEDPVTDNAARIDLLMSIK